MGQDCMNDALRKANEWIDDLLSTDWGRVMLSVKLEGGHADREFYEWLLRLGLLEEAG